MAEQSFKIYKDTAERLDKNESDIGLLKEDLSNKITKFYASNQNETHLADSDNGKIMDMMLYGRSEQKQYSGKNLAHAQNKKYYINISGSICGAGDNDIGMAIDVSKLTKVTISTRVIQDRYRIGCVNTVPIKGDSVTCYNGINKDGTKDSYTIDTTDYNYLIVNATKLEDIQVEKGTEVTSYEPYVGGQPSPSPDYPQEIKNVVNPTVNVSNEDGTKSQTVNLPYTLNAIPVSSGGNVTINGQQYIADYVDVEHGKLVKMVDSSKLDNTQSIVNKTEWLLAEPQEIGLTQEEVQTLKTLATYYPTTNISVNSEQLDGMAVFNYPISLANGWNYVKQQLNDNRDYIYDMDSRTQDVETQAAEAYVNSEYAVALTELEV